MFQSVSSSMWCSSATCIVGVNFFFFKKKTAYELRISDWSSDVCSSDLVRTPTGRDTPGVIEVKLDVTDPASVAAAAARCGDTTLLINNAGIVRLNADSLDPLMTDLSREIFETNYYGAIRACQIFAPVIAGNGGRSGEHTSELQSLLRISHADICLKK